MNVNVDINKLVDQLQKYAGPLAQHGWEILVRQQYIQGISQIIWAVALIVLSIAGYFFGKKMWQWGKTIKMGYGDNGWQYTPAVLAWLVTIIMVFVAVALTSDGVAHMLNPEYYAAQNIYCSAPGVHC